MFQVCISYISGNIYKDPHTLLAQSNPTPSPVNIFKSTGSVLHFIATKRKTIKKCCLIKSTVKYIVVKKKKRKTGLSKDYSIVIKNPILSIMLYAPLLLSLFAREQVFYRFLEFCFSHGKHSIAWKEIIKSRASGLFKLEIY